MRRCFRSAWLVAVGLFVVLPFVTIAGAANPTLVGLGESSEQLEYGIVRKLIDAELFELAVARCGSLIAEAPIDSIRRAKRQAWLLEATVERDASNAANIADALKPAEALLGELRSSSDASVNGLWLEFQIELSRLQIARRSVANYLAAPASTVSRDDALEAIRKMLDRVEELSRSLAELPIAGRTPSTDAQTGDVAGLRNRLQLLSIDAFLLRSECYPFGSDDALAAATDAMKTMQQLRDQIESEWSGKEALSIAGFRCLAAAELNEQAVAAIEAWLKAPHEASYLNQALAIGAEIFLRRDNIGRAEEWLAKSGAENRSPELALIELKLKIGRWRSSQSTGADVSTRQSRLETILKTKDEIANRYGVYWGRRAEAAVVSAGTSASTSNSSAASSSLELIKLEIRQLLAADNWKGAVDRLDQAEAAAVEGRQFEQAFSLAKSAIGLLQKQSQADRKVPSLTIDWIQRALNRSVRYSNQAGADILHFAAVEASLTVDQAEYEGHLDEHIRTWPDADSSNNARRRLVELTLLTGSIAERLDKLIGTPELLSPDELVNLLSLLALERYPKRYRSTESGNALKRDIDERLSGLSLNGDIELQLARDVSRLLSADFSHWSGNKPQHFGAGKSSSSSPYATIGRLLQAATTNSDTSFSEEEFIQWLTWFESDSMTKIGILIRLDLALSEILQMRKLVNRVGSAASAWHERANRLHRVASAAFSSIKNSVSPSVVASLDNGLFISECRLLGLSSGWEKGARDLEAKHHSASREEIWPLELARLLEGQTPMENQRALGLYRQLANGSKIGSDLWFEARLGAIRALERLGKEAEAEELAATVNALIPSPPPKWKERMVVER